MSHPALVGRLGKYICEWKAHPHKMKEKGIDIKWYVPLNERTFAVKWYIPLNEKDIGIKWYAPVNETAIAINWYVPLNGIVIPIKLYISVNENVITINGTFLLIKASSHYKIIVFIWVKIFSLHDSLTTLPLA